MENQTVTVRATLSFPSLDTPILFKGAPTDNYGTQLSNLSQRAVERLEELGVDVKFKDDDLGRGQFIDCKSKFPLDNSGRYPILFEDDGRTLFEGEVKDIGYGTVVKAKVGMYKGRDGVVRPSIKKLIIEELVRPEVADDDEEAL